MGEHEPLTLRRHADLVAKMMRYQPGLWRLVFRPPDYVYDERDRLAGIDINIQARELRLQFQKETDWDSAMEILKRLHRLDERASKISIGTRFGDHVVWGQEV